MTVAYKDLRGDDTGVTSAAIRARFRAARQIQHRRGFYNAHISSNQLRKLCALDDAGGRAHDRILRVAPTVADLAGLERVEAKHVAEAVQYRSLGRNYWG